MSTVRSLFRKFKLQILKKLPCAKYSDGSLYIPYIFSDDGKIYRIHMDLKSAENNLFFEINEWFDTTSDPIGTYLSKPSSEDTLTFTCNICGCKTRENINLVENREYPSCGHCKSTLRFRALIHALLSVLFNQPMTLAQVSDKKSIRGLGMSDWDGYANLLSTIFSYTNTFYHKKPKLDICNIRDDDKSQYDFIISSDVFEHIPLPLELGFKNMFEILKPGGICVFTVPFKKDGETEEHFPELYDYKVVNVGEKKILVNITEKGEQQQFDNLVFHGGDGETLEMRLFSEPDLIYHLEKAGFENIKIHTENYEKYGIIWPMSWAVPITASKPLTQHKE